jgi:hypothetical protein
MFIAFLLIAAESIFMSLDIATGIPRLGKSVIRLAGGVKPLWASLQDRPQEAHRSRSMRRGSRMKLATLGVIALAAMVLAATGTKGLLEDPVSLKAPAPVGEVLLARCTRLLPQPAASRLSAPMKGADDSR